MTATTAAEPKIDGWDGHSKPMTVLIEPCGCKWTRDGKARLSVCTACLNLALDAEARQLATA